MVEAVLKDDRKIFPGAAYLQGECGINGLYVGVPVKLSAKGIEQSAETSWRRKAGVSSEELCGVTGSGHNRGHS
jgi:malate dehydrogenase